MEYTSLFEPMVIIFISLLAGMLVGGIGMIYVGSRELKRTKEELDKFRELYFEEVRVNSLIDEKKHTTRTGALAR
tara:strand:- start:1394 stop:1618 length:225 start_codon:yes stop_codon:yes gene_type:complete